MYFEHVILWSSSASHWNTYMMWQKLTYVPKKKSMKLCKYYCFTKANYAYACGTKIAYVNKMHIKCDDR